MKYRKIMIIVIIAICILSLSFGIYYQIFEKDKEKYEKKAENNNKTSDVMELDDLFDNDINYQGYNVNNTIRANQTNELVYTSYTLNEQKEGKYDIKINIPSINVNNEKISNINREINSIFLAKANNIKANADKENAKNIIYTVEYTAYLNENILSLVIKSNLKEGTNAQRVIMKAYTYNLSSNEEITLEDMLDIKGIGTSNVENEIIKTVQEGIAKTANLSALGYDIYKRDINSDIYKIENSNNYFLGPNGTIYIIYAYGNSRYTSERDIVIIQ